MKHRTPDFDLRPRRLLTTTTMLSTLQVDDEGDTLQALAATALVGWRRRFDCDRAARHTALSAMPSALCSPSPQALWPRPRRPASARRSPQDPWMTGSMLSAGLALLLLAAALFWRLENPRVIHVEGADTSVRPAPELAVDAISSASP